MDKLSRNIIRGIICVKSLVITAFLISMVVIGYRQFRFYSSGFPEHQDFAKEKEGVVFGMFFYLLPLILSLLIDFKEQKNATLKGKWYLLTLSLIVLYILINQLKENHYIGLSIAVVMAVILVLTIRKQNQSLKN
mgnify:CR=1 FL=1